MITSPQGGAANTSLIPASLVSKGCDIFSNKVLAMFKAGSMCLSPLKLLSLLQGESTGNPFSLLL